MILGIDEVGRGAWAGPLVVGAVMLGGVSIAGLTDSKKLTKKRRIELDREIRQKALAIGLGWVSARHIDTIGLGPALKLAARRAVAHIRADHSEIVIDGTIKLLDDTRVTLMKKADLLVPSVSAASIVAKVARDNYMTHVDDLFPHHKFASHVGYGTAMHRAAIQEYGATPLHRFSFGPLRPYSERTAEVAEAMAPTTKAIGDAAEVAAASYLVQRGHEIMARNWRTKYCEIDIVSRHGETLYFTEVKYRKTASFGGGKAAVTMRKQRQMAFAASYFVARHQLHHSLQRLAVADVTGQPPEVQDFLELG